MMKNDKATETEKQCGDMHCAVHKAMATRGRQFVGTVTASSQKTATVEWPRSKKSPKFERYEKAKTAIKAHNPECISAKKGDIVKIIECRPISKTKSFVIIEKIGKNIAFMSKEELVKEQERVVEAKARKTKTEMEARDAEQKTRKLAEAGASAEELQ